jgi:hypothetical protein
VVHIDCTLTGASPPTATLPTWICFVDLPAPDLLVREDGEVAAVERRQRQQVGKPDEYVERGDEHQEVRKIPAPEQATGLSGDADHGRRIFDRARLLPRDLREESVDRRRCEQLPDRLEAGNDAVADAPPRR